jgi:hypothetical protein
VIAQVPPVVESLTGLRLEELLARVKPQPQPPTVAIEGRSDGETLPPTPTPVER